MSNPSEDSTDTGTHTDTERTEDELRRAQERQDWHESDERKQFYYFLAVPILAAFLAVGLGLLITKYFTPHPSRSDYLLAGGIALAAGVYLAAALTVLRLIQLRSRLHDRILLSKARAELREAEEQIVTGPPDFVSLWGITQKRIDLYHQIATTHAEKSFLYAQIAAVAGFTVVVAAAVIAAFARSTAAAISSAVIGISGGGLGAYIGATFMRSQDVAATQLRAYFDQPLDFSKYLAAERLANRLDDKDRPAVISTIIQAIVKADQTSKQA